MQTKRSTRHLTLETVEDYVDKLLPERQVCSVEKHIEDCADCKELIQRARRYTILLSRWAPEAYAEASRATEEQKRLRVMAALESLEQSEPTIAKRLRVWREQWLGRGEAAVQIAVKASGEITRILTGGVKGLIKPQARWTFSYSPRAPKLASNMGIALDFLGSPASTDTAGEERLSVEDVSGARISIDELNDAIHVTLDAKAAGALVMLVPESEEDQSLVQKIKYEAVSGTYFTSFDKVPPGKYTLVVEPLQ